MQKEEAHGTHRVDRADQASADLLDELAQVRKPLAGEGPVAEIITPLVREGALYEKLDKDRVHCYACAHNCKISPNGRGICQVRYNLN